MISGRVNSTGQQLLFSPELGLPFPLHHPSIAIPFRFVYWIFMIFLLFFIFCLNQRNIDNIWLISSESLRYLPYPHKHKYWYWSESYIYLSCQYKQEHRYMSCCQVFSAKSYNSFIQSFIRFSQIFTLTYYQANN